MPADFALIYVTSEGPYCTACGKAIPPGFRTHTAVPDALDQRIDCRATFVAMVLDPAVTTWHAIGFGFPLPVVDISHLDLNLAQRLHR